MCNNNGFITKTFFMYICSTLFIELGNIESDAQFVLKVNTDLLLWANVIYKSGLFGFEVHIKFTLM